jgi:hypothetical protein
MMPARRINGTVVGQSPTPLLTADPRIRSTAPETSGAMSARREPVLGGAPVPRLDEDELAVLHARHHGRIATVRSSGAKSETFKMSSIMTLSFKTQRAMTGVGRALAEAGHQTGLAEVGYPVCHQIPGKGPNPGGSTPSEAG